MAERLKRVRDRAYKQMTVILRYAEGIKEDTGLAEIQTRSEILENKYHAFNEAEIQLLENADYVAINDEVDEVYYTARALLMQASRPQTNHEPTNTHDLNTTLGQFIDQQKTFYEGVNIAHHVRLPKLNIEPFSGDYRYWASFNDLFQTTVHNNPNISGVHKLQMLKGVLSGEAAALIRHISITENNYAEAWSKLCNRYNKMTPIVTTLIQTFMDQKSCGQTNGKELRRMTETADEIIRGLRVLGPTAETRDPWLIYILLNKIDSETRQLWASESVNKDFSTFENLLEFLNKRCDALEICDVPAKRLYSKPTVKSFVTEGSNTRYDCVACGQQHPLFRCAVFKNNNIEARSKLVTDKNLCRNCLKKGHVSSKCFTKSSCIICQKRHHTLLHSDQSEMQSTSNPVSTSHHIALTKSSHNNLENTSNPVLSTDITSTIESNKIVDFQNNNPVVYTLYSTPTTVLPTAVIHIRSRTGQLQPFRALLDSGSQSSFVTESCAQRLGLQRRQSSISIYGLASSSAGKTKGIIDMTIYSRIDHHYNLNVTAHIIHNITNFLPKKPISIHEQIVNLELADPQFFKPNKIDVLLGADVLFEILGSEKRVIDGFPIIQSSKLGWLIAGTSNNQTSDTINLHINTDSIIQTNFDELHQLLKKFWEVEDVAVQSNPASSINICEAHYEETTTRDASGRFVVKLPFKKPRQVLGNSFPAAYQRLLAMERKLSTTPELSENYTSFMREYISLTHMTYIPWNQIPDKDDAKNYLPHHAVFKSSSSTTQLRVVFDASCKTSTQVSLNDILEVGPNIQTDLATIIVRFRKFAIALVADVEKMYRQIRVDTNDANYQLVLWRENSREPLKAYRLDTVTYGTACAPFLAVKTLKKTTEAYHHVYPRATNIINNAFYIDDLLTGCDTAAEAIQLKKELTEILSKGGFNLRKWKSNSQEFLNSFSHSDLERIPKLIEDDKSIKTLGISWNSELDTFSFKAQQSDDRVPWTKRRILSTASRIYDPMGWLAPIIILFKMLLQKIWLLNIEWDASLPNSITNIWHGIYKSLQELESIQIPRCLTTLHNPTCRQIHAFCDASEAAYGTVIYLRAVNEMGEVTVNILYAKSKVAPLKQISLPRLELCGAVLLCKSVKWCIESLAYEDIDVFAWTDSMIVLYWLSDVPRRWKSFIGNRTSTILETIPRRKWQHVESKSNPADLISRGVKPKVLSTLELWWNGPKWLNKDESNWPKSKTTIKPMYGNVEERPKFINVLTETSNEDNVILTLLSKISSWYKIRKIVVYILKFARVRRIKQQEHPRSKITPSEMNEAEKIILREVQKTSFKPELANLNKNETLPTKNHLSSLDPFVDSDGLLRVGGRLSKSSLPYSSKHPIILPKNHIICTLIIRETHLNHMHAGNSLTLSMVRNKYWMIGARCMIKHCVKSCVTCIRYRSHKTEQKMADLPVERCTQSRPFLNTGLDYAGPVYIKTSKRKSSPTEKAYVAVFVCMAVKAVHLEIVSSLDTNSFLAALRRFNARRGTPAHIWCDNGSNFVGANKELQQLKHQIIKQTTNSLISDFLLQKNIIFHFNPARAPHFGGLWESTVKSFKYHLKRVTGMGLTFEEMTTLTTQIESLLNSRPLCRISDDPVDLEVLTPAHFLVGESLMILPEPNLEELPLNKLSRWQNIQQRLQGFWSRWHRDYLTSLQHRYKWKTVKHHYQVDDVVLIQEDNLYPGQWLLARITHIHPGSDGIARVVTLKTSKSSFKRPVNKIVKLNIKK